MLVDVVFYMNIFEAALPTTKVTGVRRQFISKAYEPIQGEYAASDDAQNDVQSDTAIFDHL